MKSLLFVLFLLACTLLKGQGFEKIRFGSPDTAYVGVFTDELTEGKYTVLCGQYVDHIPVGGEILEYDVSGSLGKYVKLPEYTGLILEPERIIRSGINQLILAGNAWNNTNDEQDLFLMTLDNSYQIQSIVIVNNPTLDDRFLNWHFFNDSIVDIACKDLDSAYYNSYVLRVRLNGQIIKQTTPGYPVNPVDFYYKKSDSTYYIINSDVIFGFSADSLNPLGILFDQFVYNQSHNYPVLQTGNAFGINDSVFLTMGHYMDFSGTIPIREMGISLWNNSFDPVIIFHNGEDGYYNQSPSNSFSFIDPKHAFLSGYSLLLPDGIKQQTTLDEYRILVFNINTETGAENWRRLFYSNYCAFPDFTSSTSDGGCLITGSRTDLNGIRTDMFLLKLDSLGNCTPDVISENQKPAYEIFPNPVSTYMRVSSQGSIISFSISDLSGRSLVNEKCYGNNDILIETEMLDPGIYLLKASFNDGSTAVKKFLRL
ncbi:MAG TPA: T9SS type A sorting domain-containing protein [Bacteroidales bacterium]|nr:T9SS type A sorting domain-containing protein [Bacteroidales bacterium]